jgi:ABC-type dipeptide/oligopeptide/nickel transport system permease subunit
MAVKSANLAATLHPMPRDTQWVSPAPQSYWRMALHALRSDRLTMAGLVFVLVVALLAYGAAPITAGLGVDPTTTYPENFYQPPYIVPYLQWRLGLDGERAARILGKSEGRVHWLGTDELGRDLLARLLYGGRVSLTIGLIGALLSMLLGVFFGAMAGYFGGYVDDLVMWVINTVTTIPLIYLLIIINAFFRPNPTTLTLFFGFLGWFGAARFMRGQVFKVRSLDYCLAARALGVQTWRVLLRHIVPNCIPLIIVLTATDIGILILSESVLSSLGLGVQPPFASWGNMLNRAQEFLTLREAGTRRLMGLHLILLPGILTAITVLAFSLVGDGLRDALDPTLKNKK